tara:strand:+ start:104 stop:1036 length:933 start_codon:yes stop_codon:yes gene_type:complete
MTKENDKDKHKNIADETHLELSTSPNTYRENQVINKSKDRDTSNIYCGNCGNIGHVYRKCRFPITSCGVILYKINPEYVENDNKIDRFLFLLIQRKDTLGYIEFLRGKYDEHNLGYITKLVETMTIDEIDKIKKHTFDELWNMLWFNKNIKQYQTEYDISSKKFNNLKNGKFFKIGDIIKNANLKYLEKEWGFPKGRRNLRESDYDCALREFQEETGFKREEYEILRNIRPVEEIFYGSNNIRYKHIYHIALSKCERDITLDPENYYQITEVGNISWFTLNEALERIRPYNVEKKEVLKKVNKLLINNNC